MELTITAFKWVPEFARGFVRDLRPRWACEELGLTYDERLIGQDEKNSEAYRKEQPFTQVPVLEVDGVSMFESGAILLHLAQMDNRLLPADPQMRAHAISWLFAALNSIEPLVFELGNIDLFSKEEEWAKLRRPGLIEFLEERLNALAKALADKDFLVGSFTVADIAMATVLRETIAAGLPERHPPLAAYLERCTGRTAFKKALTDQLASFDRNAPSGD